MGLAKFVAAIFYYEILTDGTILKKKIEFTNGLSKTSVGPNNQDAARTYKIPVSSTVSRFRAQIDSTQTNTVARYLGKVRVDLFIGNKSFSEYMFFRQNTVDMEMEKPTNIEGGYGVFWVRRKARLSGVKMDPRTFDFFITA